MGRLPPVVHDEDVRMLAVLGLLAAAAALAEPAAARTHVLGRSWQGRPIVVHEVGNPAGIPVLVVGCIHGNEPAGIAVARALARR
jgi:predicted deacylase